MRTTKAMVQERLNYLHNMMVEKIPLYRNANWEVKLDCAYGGYRIVVLEKNVVVYIVSNRDTISATNEKISSIMNVLKML